MEYYENNICNGLYVQKREKLQENTKNDQDDSAWMCLPLKKTKSPYKLD